MLPSVVRMIPVEIDHIIGLVVERLVPEAFQEIVVQQSLYVVRSSMNSEHGNRLLKRDRSVQPRQLPAELGDSFTCRVTLLRGERHEVLANMIIGKYARRSHFPIDVEKELATGPDLLLHGLDRRSRVGRVMQHP